MPPEPRVQLRPADALVIVPPFAGLDRPSLGVHVLQACAKAGGVTVSVLYANLLFGGEVGEPTYQAVSYGPSGALLGERFFAAAAYGSPPFGHDDAYVSYFSDRAGEPDDEVEIDLTELMRLQPHVAEWLDTVAALVVAQKYRVVGCTTTFEQTSASIALLSRIKQLRPETITIIGGANCDGPMAEGIRGLSDAVDYVFAGECEEAFPAFMREVLAGRPPEARVIRGAPCAALDALPTPDFSEYYAQLATALPNSELVKGELVLLPYESSRGCWWGAKHHCTFCGLNAQTMQHREKSADRMISELRLLLERHPTRKVCVVDNIMPRSYFKTLLPRLATEVPGIQVFYEQKSNLTLDQVEALRQAGVCDIQPGIEALSSALLTRMDKGVTARQNIALMRYARAAGLTLTWNLLYAFPGDRVQDYEETLGVIPMLRHLEPPGGLSHLSLDRFSPYFDTPEKYGIRDLRPMPGYEAVIPRLVDPASIAYHFIGTYASGAVERPDLIAKLKAEVDHWMSLWRKDDLALPAFAITPLSDELYMLFDSRGLDGTEEIQFVDRLQASVALTGRRLAEKDENVEWALDARAVVELDGRYVPLATAAPEHLREFEAERRVAQLVPAAD
jgi:ribosomal peptide maturation radical SAM protein 1